jgi:hypothetical protein
MTIRCSIREILIRHKRCRCLHRKCSEDIKKAGAMSDSFLREEEVGVKSGVQVRRRWMSAKPLPAIAHSTAAPLPRAEIENLHPLAVSSPYVFGRSLLLKITNSHAEFISASHQKGRCFTDNSELSLDVTLQVRCRYASA